MGHNGSSAPNFPRKPPKRARTYQLSPVTIQRIDEMAKRLECWPSQLVDMLLTRGMDALDSGEWQLNRRPVVYRLEWPTEKAGDP